MGRVSVMRTRSPTPHSFFSSWTLNLVRRCTVLRYRRWALDVPTWTMIVLFILSAITVPSRTLRWPRDSLSVAAVLVSGLVAVAVSVIWFPQLSCGCAWAWPPAPRVLLLLLLPTRARGAAPVLLGPGHLRR